VLLSQVDVTILDALAASADARLVPSLCTSVLLRSARSPHAAIAKLDLPRVSQQRVPSRDPARAEA